MDLATASLNSARLPPRRQSTITKRNSIQPSTNDCQSQNGHEAQSNTLYRSQSYQMRNFNTPMESQKFNPHVELGEESIQPTIDTAHGSHVRIQRAAPQTNQRPTVRLDMPKVTQQQILSPNENLKEVSKCSFNRYWCFALIMLAFAVVLLTTLITTVVLTAVQTKSTTSTTTVTTATTTSITTVTTSTTTSTTSSTTVTTSITTSSTTSSTSTSTSSTITTTSTSTTSSTSTVFDPCGDLVWNQTSEVIAGNSSKKVKDKELVKPAFIYIDGNDTLYVSDKDGDNILMWRKDGNESIIVANSSSGLNKPEGITFDKNGFMYVSLGGEGQVLRYSPDFSNVEIVAGNTSGKKTSKVLEQPLGIVVDDNLNLYVAERAGKSITGWAANATNGTIVIGPAGSGIQFYGLSFSPQVSNQVYVSSKEKDAVYLWTFGSSTPDLSLTNISGSTVKTLNEPMGIKLDKYGNLYVADYKNARVVMYCTNSTEGRVVIDGKLMTPELKKVVDIALDSNMNLYVSDEEIKQVLKFYRL